MSRYSMIAFWLVALLGLGAPLATAQEPTPPVGESPTEILRRMERRLDDLARENREIRAENARLLKMVKPADRPAGATRPDGDAAGISTPPVPAPFPPATIVEPPVASLVPIEPQPMADPANTGPGTVRAVPPPAASFTPGEGVTVSMFNGTSRLRLGARLSALSIFSTARPFSPGLPVFLYPASPSGLASNTFDLHARQSALFGQFEGPEILGFTPRAAFLTLLYNDNITSDNYGLLWYYAYGELVNAEMRFAAGLQQDIFNPVSPTVLPFSLLYGSGNAGSYRGQLRFERFFRPAEDFQLTFQGGLSEPIATLVRGQLTDPLVEDNGWPNVEGRLEFGFGAEGALMAGRKHRPLELGVSGVVGQIRTTRISPETPGPVRSVIDVWGLGADAQWAITDRFGLKGEFFTGQSLGEYNGSILQNFNYQTHGPIRATGGWGEIYYRLHPKVALNVGYGIDHPIARDLAPGQLAVNQTFFNVLTYDLSKTFQIGFEVDYRKTNYVAPLLTSDGVLFMTQFLWRF